MKNVMKVCAMVVMALAMFSCEKEDTYIYSVSNGLHVGSDVASVMSYAADKVQMDVASVMTFTGTEKEADKLAKAEFAKRLGAIDDTQFCGMMSAGEYYEFFLNRLEGETYVIVDSKRYNGTK